MSFLNMVTSSDVVVPREQQQQYYAAAAAGVVVAPRVRVEIANGTQRGTKFITELSGCSNIREFVSRKLCKNSYLRGKEVKVFLDEYELLGDTSCDVLGHEDRIYVVVCGDDEREEELEEEGKYLSQETSSRRERGSREEKTPILPITDEMNCDWKPPERKGTLIKLATKRRTLSESRLRAAKQGTTILDAFVNRSSFASPEFQVPKIYKHVVDADISSVYEVMVVVKERRLDEESGKYSSVAVEKKASDFLRETTQSKKATAVKALKEAKIAWIKPAYESRSRKNENCCHVFDFYWKDGPDNDFVVCSYSNNYNVLAKRLHGVCLRSGREISVGLPELSAMRGGGVKETQKQEQRQKQSERKHAMTPQLGLTVPKKQTPVRSKEDERLRLTAQVVYAPCSDDEVGDDDDDDDDDSHGLEALSSSSSSSEEEGGEREISKVDPAKIKVKLYEVIKGAGRAGLQMSDIMKGIFPRESGSEREKVLKVFVRKSVYSGIEKGLYVKLGHGRYFYALKKGAQMGTQMHLEESTTTLLRKHQKPEWMCVAGGGTWSCTEKRMPGFTACQKHATMDRWCKQVQKVTPEEKATETGTAKLNADGEKDSGDQEVNALKKVEEMQKLMENELRVEREKIEQEKKEQLKERKRLEELLARNAEVELQRKKEREEREAEERRAEEAAAKARREKEEEEKRKAEEERRAVAEEEARRMELARSEEAARLKAEQEREAEAERVRRIEEAARVKAEQEREAKAERARIEEAARVKAEQEREAAAARERAEGERQKQIEEARLEAEKKLEDERLEAERKLEEERLQAAKKKMEEEEEKRRQEELKELEEQRKKAAEAERVRRIEEAARMKAEQEREAAAARERAEAERQKQIEEARLEAEKKLEEERLEAERKLEEERLQAAKKKMEEEEENRRREEQEEREKQKVMAAESVCDKKNDATTRSEVNKETQEVTPTKVGIVLKPGEVACGAPTNKQVRCPHSVSSCPWHINEDNCEGTQAHQGSRHLLTLSDIGPSLKGKWISVLWPDTGEWFDAEILNMNNSTAKLWYPADDLNDEMLGEREDINLDEAVGSDEISWPLVRRKPLTLQAKLVDETSSLDMLRNYISSCGGKLEGNWSVQVKVRQSGQSALTGHVDHYFFSPEGKKYRSKVEVARALNVPKLPKSAKKRKLADNDIVTPPAKKREKTHTQRSSGGEPFSATAAAATDTSWPPPDFFLLQQSLGDENLSGAFLMNDNTNTTTSIDVDEEKPQHQRGDEKSNVNSKNKNASSPVLPLFKNKSGEMMQLTVHQNTGGW